MIEYAKFLSKKFVFVQVDLYDYNNKLYLSELTLTSNNRFKKWKSKDDSIKIANLINIKNVKSYLFNK